MSDYLCQELIVEIFTRLPTKSLIRFRSVSKSLRSCIDNPSFIRLHTLRSSQKLLILHKDYDRKKNYINYFYTLHSEDQLPSCSYLGLAPSVSPVVEHFFFVGSLNGIICATCNDMIILWNPSIRRKLTIPDYPLVRYSSEFRCFFVMGFGFDPIIDDYKIVSLFHKQPTGVQRSFVYTIKTGTWSEIASPPIVLSFMRELGCLVNGSLHWMVEYYLNDTDKICHLCIMTLDLSSHVFGTIELPNWITSKPYNLINISGSLVLVCNDGTNTWIYVRRREYHNNHYSFTWHVDFKFKQYDYIGLTRVLQLNANGDLLIYSPSTGFHSYNPQTMVRSSLVEFTVSSNKIGMEMCVESLELLDRGTPYDKVNPPSSSSSSSCVAKKRKSRTTIEKLSDSCILCSTTLLRKICNIFSNGARL